MCYYIKAKSEKDIADGFMPKTDDWEKVDWADVIVFDDVLGKAPKLRRCVRRAKKSSTAWLTRSFGRRSLVGKKKLKKPA